MSTIKANTLLHSDGTTTTQPSIPALDQRMAKAWINFNGSGTVAIRASYNVSSITDNGTGDFTTNFANNLPSGNYVFSGSGASWGGGYIIALEANSHGQAALQTASQHRFGVRASSGAKINNTNILAIYFGG